MNAGTEITDERMNGLIDDLDDLMDGQGGQGETGVKLDQVAETFTGEACYFDIETGPRPWPEIEQFYTPPEPLAPWDESMVAYGNLKDPAKRKEKRDSVFIAYQAKLADEEFAKEAHKAEWIAKAALSPITGQVLAIGYFREECGTRVWGNDKSIEADLLADFWVTYTNYTQNKERLIGFNIFGFDLPFLVRRSWLLGVDVPPGVLNDGRYWSKTFVDLMQTWGCGSREFISLDTVAKYFGVGGKPEGVDGGAFAGLWTNPETRPQAVAYLENDLAMTAAVAGKMGVC